MVQTLEFTLPELMERVRKGQIPSTAKIQITFDETAVPPQDPTARPIRAMGAGRRRLDAGTAAREPAHLFRD